MTMTMIAYLYLVSPVILAHDIIVAVVEVDASVDTPASPCDRSKGGVMVDGVVSDVVVTVVVDVVVVAGGHSWLATTSAVDAK